MTSCPEGAVLAAYLAGERSEVELEEIERHVLPVVKLPGGLGGLALNSPESRSTNSAAGP